MSLQTYADLKAATANWLVKTSLTAVIPDLITTAEGWIFRNLRVREMETAFNATIAAGVVAIPSDFLDARALRIDGSPSTPLSPMDLAQLISSYPLRSSCGLPKYFAVEGANLEFGPFPDSAYTVLGTYFAKPLNLSDSQTTNTIFPAYNDLYLWATLTEVAPLIREDSRIAVWQTKRDSALEEIVKATKRQRYGGGLIIPRAV